MKRFSEKANRLWSAFSKRLSVRRGVASRRGVTMVEVAISLAVIAIVSGAAALMSVQSTKIEARSITAAYVEGYSESVVECFFASEDEAEFKAAIEKLELSYTDNGHSTYEFSGMGFTMNVSFSFADRKISLVAFDNENRTILIATP